MDLELTPEGLLGDGSGRVAAELVDLGQQSDVVRSVAAREGTGRGLRRRSRMCPRPLDCQTIPVILNVRAVNAPDAI